MRASLPPAGTFDLFTLFGTPISSIRGAEVTRRRAISPSLPLLPGTGHTLAAAAYHKPMTKYVGNQVGV